jgi:hypothetical protein
MITKRFGFIFDEIWGSIYLIPTISIEYDSKLNGHWAVELRWLKWIIGVNFERN